MAKNTRGAKTGQATQGGQASAARRSGRGQGRRRTRRGQQANRARLSGAANKVEQQLGSARRLLSEARDAAQNVGTTTVDTARGIAAGARDAATGVAKGTQRTAAQVAGKVRENPWPAILIGSGATWLVVDAVRGRSSENSRGRGRRTRRGKSAGQLANQAVSTVADAGRSIGGHVEEWVKENPVLAGAATLGIGLAVGLALPSTMPENALLGDTRDALVRRAKETARGRVREVAGAMQRFAGRS